MNPRLELARWDGSAYYPDGRIRFDAHGSGLTLAEAQVKINLSGFAGQGFESSGVALASQPFTGGISNLGNDWRTYVADFDPSLRESSEAISGAVLLDGYSSSSSPSRGAVQVGQAAPKYGNRINLETPRPKAPLNLRRD